MSSVKRKVVLPALPPRVEETYNLAGKGIDTCEVRPFVEIAALAGQREVGDVVPAAVLLRDEMLNVVS